MNDAEINSMLFRGVITNLHSLYSGDGNMLSTDTGVENVGFSIAYQERPTECFAHNYERDKFLHSRDRYIRLTTNCRSYVVVKSVDREFLTLYSKPFEIAFPRDHSRVMRILEKLVHKFYDNVEVEEMSTLTRVDLSNGNNGSNNHRIYNEV